MRLALAFWLALSLVTVIYGQTSDPSERIVREMIDKGFFEGSAQKTLGELGDAAAVLATKIVSGRDLSSILIDNALIVIRESFADVSFVENMNDREPRTTQLLLRYFDLSTSDAALKKRIADTRRYVNERYAASLPSGKQC